MAEIIRSTGGRYCTMAENPETAGSLWVPCHLDGSGSVTAAYFFSFFCYCGLFLVETQSSACENGTNVFAKVQIWYDIEEIMNAKSRMSLSHDRILGEVSYQNATGQNKSPVPVAARIHYPISHSPGRRKQATILKFTVIIMTDIYCNHVTRAKGVPTVGHPPMLKTGRIRK
jgi:hypothetical protein